MFDFASAETARGSAKSGGTEAEPASEAARRVKVRREKMFLKTSVSLTVRLRRSLQPELL
jgi:hypothetical protein